MPAAGGPRGRSLTIGEAVARLAAEFPGIRAETLRLLEQQGAVSPARTSSGFRRYTERDLDAVRRALSGPPRPRGSAHATLWRASAAAYPADADPAIDTAAEFPPPGARGTAAAAPAAGDAVSGRPTTRSAGAPAPAVPHSAAATLAPAPASLPTTTAPPGPAEPPSEPSQGTARRRTARWPDPDYFTPELGEVALGREALARAAGIAPEWVDELRAHGMIGGQDPATGADLLVARAAAELIGYGIEPRHLLPVRIAAGRAASLVEAAVGGSSSRSGTAQVAAALVRLEAALLRAALLDD